MTDGDQLLEDLGYERATVWRDTSHRANREHRCDCCGGTIARGERYTRHFSVNDHRPCSEACCARCETIRRELAAHPNNVSTTPSRTPYLLMQFAEHIGPAEGGDYWLSASARIRDRHFGDLAAPVADEQPDGEKR